MVYTPNTNVKTWQFEQYRLSDGIFIAQKGAFKIVWIWICKELFLYINVKYVSHFYQVSVKKTDNSASHSPNLLNSQYLNPKLFQLIRV